MPKYRRKQLNKKFRYINTSAESLMTFSIAKNSIYFNNGGYSFVLEDAEGTKVRFFYRAVHHNSNALGGYFENSNDLQPRYLNGDINFPTTSFEVGKEFFGYGWNQDTDTLIENYEIGSSVNIFIGDLTSSLTSSNTNEVLTGVTELVSRTVNAINYAEEVKITASISDNNIILLQQDILGPSGNTDLFRGVAEGVNNEGNFYGELTTSITTNNFSGGVTQTITYFDPKSGNCTSSIGSILDHNQLSFSYFNHEIIHSTLGFKTQSEAFNDNFTNVFIEQDIIPTLGIPKNSFELYENNILHTPNEFNYTTSNTDLITAIPNVNSFNNILKENYIKTELISYKEDLSKNNNIKRNSINISFDKATTDIKLSFSLNSETSSLMTITDSGGNEIVSFPEFNGNTVILENGLKNDYNFSYVGDISENYFSNITSFIEAPICFNGLTTLSSTDDNRYESNYLTLPIQDFGFPYSEKFKGQDRHLIRMRQHITKPFVIEKIRLRANISNYSVSQTNNPCVNFINFFIINQKGKLNPENVSEEYEVTDYVEETSVYQNFSNLPSRFTLTPKYSQNIKSLNTATVNQSVYVTEESQPLYGYETVPLQQRDLISTITIANYSQPTFNNTFHDREKIANNVDLFIDNTGLPKLNSSHSVECIYENKNIEVTSDVKNFYSNKNLNRFSSFNVYPRKEYSNRTNTFFRSGRSVANEGLNNTSQIVYHDTDSFDKTIIHKEKNSISDGYILKPEDTIYIGISLSTQFNIQESNLSGKDYVTIGMSDNKPLSIDLIGYYLEDAKEKRINLKEVKQYKNFKKISHNLKEVVDRVGLDSVCLSKGAYYDIFKNVAEAGTDNTGNLFKFSGLDKATFGGFLSLPNDNLNPPIHHDEQFFIDVENNIKKAKKYYFSTERFGQPLDKINVHKNEVYERTTLKSSALTTPLVSQINYPITKKFKKGFFIEKVAGTVVGKIKFDFTNMKDFTGQNFLKEKIMSSFIDLKGSTPLFGLVFAISDNVNNRSLFLIQPDYANLGHSPSEYYIVNSHFGFGPSQKYAQTFISDDIISAFENNNGTYGIDLEVQKLKFVNTFIEAINNINVFTQTTQPTSTGVGGLILGNFRLDATASLVPNTQYSDIYEVEIRLNKAGSLNNANIDGSLFNSNIILENFSLTQGDIINSYNTDKHAYYSSSDIMFEDNY